MINFTTLKALSKVIAKDDGGRFALGDIRKDGVDLIAANGRLLLVVKNALDADEAMSATDSIGGVIAQAFAEHCKKAKKTSTDVHWDTLVGNEQIFFPDREIGRFPDYKAIMKKPQGDQATTVKIDVKRFQILLDVMKAEGKESFLLTIGDKNKPMHFEVDDLEGMITPIVQGD